MAHFAYYDQFCYNLTMDTFEIEQELRDQNRCLAGMRHWLKVAAEYQHEDPVKRLDGIQAALTKAAEYEPRTKRNTKRRRYA